MIHLDSFTSLDDLKPKERRDPEAVLAVLRRTRRFSVWDMDNKAICSTVCDLLRSGRIKQTDRLGYPWCAVEIVEPSSPPRVEPET
jgi:hypothetical protein